MPWHVSSWTPAPHELPSGSDEWIELYDAVNSKTCYWTRRSHRTVWTAPVGVEVVWVGAQDEGGGPLQLTQGHSCQYE